jgi:hypothetical protein
MSDQTFDIEIQADLLDKLTRATPVQAIAELIWNGLDADAKRVVVETVPDHLEGISKIVVTDDGVGIDHRNAAELFRRLGGSWKKPGAKTKDGRYLHGQEGRGRFKAFALGRVVDWDVYYDRDSALWTYRISMLQDNLRQVRISDERPAAGQARGVTVSVAELHKSFRSLEPINCVQELSEIFALYLKDYRDVSIFFENVRVNPEAAITSTESFMLPEIEDAGQRYEAKLEVIGWRTIAKRVLYLCDEHGFPMCQVDTRFHVGNFQFSAYLSSGYMTNLLQQGRIELAEMDEGLKPVIEGAIEKIKTYARQKQTEEAKAVVEEWKAEQIYPYAGAPQTRVEEVERQVFDIVAVNVSKFLPEFDQTPRKSKAWHLRMLRSAIEHSPEELQLILNQVLDLPIAKQNELAQILRETTLSALINAAKIVTDRLKFLAGLEQILFVDDFKKNLKERSQLHRIIADGNCWLFGEEYSLSVSDRSLTEVLRKHKELLRCDVAIDEPVKHPSKTRGIIDLMLSREIRRHSATERQHLIVELKAPKVTIGQKEIGQIENYAIAVAEDERFRGVNTKWAFWILSDDYDGYVSRRMDKDDVIRLRGDEEILIYVKTWSQVVQDNKSRMQFFQEKLEYEADRGASLEYLKTRYAAFLEGVFEQTDRDGSDDEERPQERKVRATKTATA